MMKNHCTYIISEAPQTPWWGNGMPKMKDNHAMELHEGEIPDDAGLRAELEQCMEFYREAALKVIRVPFSPYLDALYRHDGIFCTDGAITTVNGHGKPRGFSSNFSVSFRQPEAEPMKRLLKLQGIEVLTPPKHAKIEGGETHYTPNDHLYFGGLHRANIKGHRFIIERSNVKDAILLKTDGFHLDTVLVPVLDAQGSVHGVLACRDAVEKKSWEKLHQFCSTHEKALVEIDAADSIGTEQREWKDATYAVNCMPTAGLLMGNGRFQTPGVEDVLQSWGVRHITTPMPESAKSAGSFHCLTQQCPVHNSQEVIRWYMHGEVGALYRLLKRPSTDDTDLELMETQVPLMDFDAYSSYGIQPEEIEDLNRAREKFLHTVGTIS